ncbi:hypothetical protein [Streptomyces sp. NPDC007904]|uniref:hypothetical protein n=1 Tax=Streptomyces sp. NPDC007904 TaxID=3364787 RepID=UPI0036F02D7D
MAGIEGEDPIGDSLKKSAGVVRHRIIVCILWVHTVLATLYYGEHVAHATWAQVFFDQLSELVGSLIP